MVLRGLAATLAIAAAMAAAGSADGARSPKGAPSFMKPSTISPTCTSSRRAEVACAVVARFFRAVNSRAFVTACSLLGRRLRADTYGLACTEFLRLGVPEPVPWGILAARRSGSATTILVTVGQSELGAWRMRRHRAFVGIEGGAPRILRTQLVD
jgi:hypothetical protein